MAVTNNPNQQNQRPSVGQIVHYTAPGSGDGIYPPICRAGIVSEVQDELTVSLMLINPTGIHFRQAVPFSPGDPAEGVSGSRCWPGSQTYPAYTWHRPDDTTVGS